MGSLYASQKWSLIWKKIFFVVNHQNIGCKLLLKEEKNWKFETWPFSHYQTDREFWNTVYDINQASMFLRQFTIFWSWLVIFTLFTFDIFSIIKIAKFSKFFCMFLNPKPIFYSNLNSNCLDIRSVKPPETS